MKESEAAVAGLPPVEEDANAVKQDDSVDAKHESDHEDSEDSDVEISDENIDDNDSKNERVAALLESQPHLLLGYLLARIQVYIL